MMDNDELLQVLRDDFNEEPEIDDEPEHKKDAQLTIVMKKGETVDRAKARAALSPEYHAATSIFQLGQILSSRGVDLTKLAERLEYQSRKLSEGDLGQAESMLASQAHTLDSLFHHLLRRSALNMSNEFDVVDKLMKLALKAQSQCRTTLDTLASIKNPPELIRQTNIAHGHQQVNNFPENRDGENELLEETDGERLDTGTPPEAVRVDSEVETVDEQHRTKNKHRQG